MMKKQLIPLETWERKEHFEFFKQFDEPFFGICANVDCSRAFQRAKSLKTSFFLYYLHKSLCAVNELPAFRYRIEEDAVYDYERIDASPTIGRANGTFGFSYIPFHENYAEFEASAQEEIARVQASNSLHTPHTGKIHVIHYSSIPWVHFTAIKHAQNVRSGDSIPKISFGKVLQEGDKKRMPVSVYAHHSLVDGLHVGQYLERFEHHLNS